MRQDNTMHIISLSSSSIVGGQSITTRKARMPRLSHRSLRRAPTVTDDVDMEMAAGNATYTLDFSLAKKAVQICSHIYFFHSNYTGGHWICISDASIDMEQIYSSSQYEEDTSDVRILFNFVMV